MKAQAGQALAGEAVLDLLSRGEMEVEGLLPGSSNYTFLTTLSNAEVQLLAVYKPSQGETPLWDFPYGTLCQRELAAYLISEALGWGLVPPTVLRLGTYGRGAVQAFVDADFSQHYFTLQDRPAFRQALQRMAAFDVVINNADRKAGHCLLDRQQRIWAIDHGVSFHSQVKLRTVIWDFAKEPLPGEMRQDLSGLQDGLAVDGELRRALCDLLSDAEIAALGNRLERLLAAGRFPVPDSNRRPYPWPLV